MAAFTCPYFRHLTQMISKIIDFVLNYNKTENKTKSGGN